MLYKSQNKRHIILIGFRGVGKSTIGQLLEKKLSYPFYDSDNEIVKEYGKSIPQLFEEYGEAYFRQIEEKVIKKVCLIKEPIIISTGGGVVLSERNRILINEHGFIILLTTSEKEIYERIRSDENRPSLTDNDLKKEIKHLLETRSPYYQQNKEFEVDTTSSSPKETVTKILNYITKQAE